jgi:cysteine desulfurase / selenocysteine lyase
MSLLDQILASESARLAEFPVAREQIFMAHGGVTILPRRVASAMQDYIEQSCLRHQEFAEAWRAMNETRVVSAQLIGAKSSEISLIGPTSLGLSLVANGLPWNEGDEIVCYQDDYPANVYPWLDLRRKGVVIRLLKPETPGHITPQVVDRALTAKTKLVALASCHFLTGYRIDVDAIGRLLRERKVLFCLDAIQTLGAFDTRVDHVDFLSADAHKWMLGPMAAGIFYVREEHHDLLRPSLIGAWNVKSPNFIAQEEVVFEPGGRRYEPGVLNMAGIIGMKAGLEMLLEIGIEKISERLLHLKSCLVSQLEPLGFHVLPPREGAHASSITTTWRDDPQETERIAAHLAEKKIAVSLRHDRSGRPLIRFSPHFYNTESEIERVAAAIREAIADR